MTHQIDGLSAQKCNFLSRCVRAHIIVMKSDPSLAVGFPDFLEDNWQTNGCIPLRIDCSALFQWYDCDMSSFYEKKKKKKQAIICLAALRAPTTFVVR